MHFSKFFQKNVLSTRVYYVMNLILSSITTDSKNLPFVDMELILLNLCNICNTVMKGFIPIHLLKTFAGYTVC